MRMVCHSKNSSKKYSVSNRLHYTIKQTSIVVSRDLSEVPPKPDYERIIVFEPAWPGY